MLKQIGTKARLDIEHLLDDKVTWNYGSKFKKDWRDKQTFLTDYGYRNDDY